MISVLRFRFYASLQKFPVVEQCCPEIQIPVENSPVRKPGKRSKHENPLFVRLVPATYQKRFCRVRHTTPVLHERKYHKFNDFSGMNVQLRKVTV